MPSGACSCKVVDGNEIAASWPRNSLITVLCKGPRGERAGMSERLRCDEIPEREGFQQWPRGPLQTHVVIHSPIRTEKRPISVRIRVGHTRHESALLMCKRSSRKGWSNHAVAESIGVDRYEDAGCGAMCLGVGVDTAASFRKADVGLLGDQQVCIVATIREVGHDAACDAAVELVFKEAPIRAAFASGV